MRSLRRVAAPIFCLFASLAVRAAPLQVAHAEVELVSAASSVKPGAPLLVALRIRHEPEWHTYWKNPGDSGMPTRIAWTLPEGFQAGPILWPTPQRLPVGPLTNFGYEGELLLLTEISVPEAIPEGGMVRLQAQGEWLICKEICLPGGANVTLDLPVGDGARHPAWGERLRRARDEIPAPLQGWRVEAAPTDEHIVLKLEPVAVPVPVLERLTFFPDDPEIIDNTSPQALARSDSGGYVLRLTAAPGFKGELGTLSGVLVASPGLGQQGPARAATIAVPYPGGAPRVRANPPAAPIDAAQIAAASAAAGSDAARLGLLVAVAFAFVGGIVLNLMPCVFPVVSIKVLGFVEQAHGSRQDLRAHGLSFAAGIVVCFWIVAGALLLLRATGEALGWGYQLQSPPIVAGLAVLFFLLGLNLSGLFEFGLRLQALAGNVSERRGAGGAFLSGLLATVVATPCTAPFMGAALGYALTQPAYTSMTVFTALAAGMAAPYVALSFLPGLAERLPRPGRWMETLKQLLAFPLYLTVVWLVWVLGEQLGVGAAARLLSALVLLAAAAWAWNRFIAHGRSHATRTLGAAAVIALTLGAVAVGWPRGVPAPGRTEAGTAWQPYSEAALSAELAAGRPVFVDFTAAWCVTCQVNKRLVLESQPVREAFLSRGVVRMRADWTNRDPEITAALARLGRSGVPVYALYTGGGGTPELLPELLTQDLVVEALDRAALARKETR
jgi:thiol:disulfide interchange protein DsbD